MNYFSTDYSADVMGIAYLLLVMPSDDGRFISKNALFIRTYTQG